MSHADPATSPPPPLVRALAALKEARRRLEEVDRAKREPLAIVGMGCRFPGASRSPEAYWSLIAQGRDGVIDVPRDRWPLEQFHDDDPLAPGRMRFRQAGFVDGIDDFDAAFFEISPREAERMDPQQRLLLQVAWEAIDDAGLDAARLAGTDTGVWVGVNSHDYLDLQLRDPANIDTYTLTGGTGSIVANRLSYLLDLRGPSLTVDTACSTSLVAVHLACQSLRSGECDTAVIGAVNLIMSPFTTMAHARGMPMAADNRCKTFDARADGYVRGEGCGVIVLKRLADAQRDGDSIWALIRGSAVNQDGRTNGLTAPNGLSQQEVIRRALAMGSIEPSSVGYLEAHGTGTVLGEPIEVEAAQQVYGDGRTEPCALGSVKTNIGHLESAAGIAGLIKVALALHHRRIPAVRDFTTLNPHIDLDDERFFVPTVGQDWLSAVRRGAVSSFGAGGTNAHVVLEQGPPQSSEPVAEASDAPHFVLISARGESALRHNVERWSQWLDGNGDALELADIAHTSVLRRTRHEHGLVMRARDVAQLQGGLHRWLAGEPDDDVVTGHAAPGQPRRLVFVCPGQGSQWVGMARDLFAHQPVFRRAIEACGAAIAEHTDWSLVDRLRDSSGPFDRIDVVQPTLWAVMVALAAQWSHWGVRPDAIIGHSMGETAAAAISGGLSLSDAARVICRRSRLLLRAAGRGLMLLVAEPRERVEARIDDQRERVSVAVCNSPGTTVVSGDPEAIEQLEVRLRRDNVFHRRVAVDVASHSPQMDPLADDLRAELAGLRPTSPTIPMLSTVDLEMIGGASLDAEYWVRNLRQPVRFGEATARLIDQGHDVFVELSPHLILGSAIEQTSEAMARETETTTVVLPSMLRDRPGVETMQRTWAALLAHGFGLDAETLVPRRSTVLRAPVYRWSDRKYWFCEDRWAPLSVGVAEDGPVSSLRARMRASCYRLEWVVRRDTPLSSGQGLWWIVGSDASWTRAVAGACEAAAIPVAVMAELPAASDPRWSDGPVVVLDVRAPGPDVQGAEPATRAVQQLLETLQCIRRVHAAAPHSWTLTRGAQDERGSAPAAAAIWGLGRAIAIEHAGPWGGLVDVPADASPLAVAERLVEALRRDDGEDQLRLDERGRVLVPRIVSDPDAALAREGLRGGEDRSLLVVGPPGGAVAAVIDALRERTPGPLLWLDEGPAAATREDDRRALDRAERVTRAQLVPRLEQLAREGHPLTGVVRLPARALPCPLRELDADRVAAVMRAEAEAVDGLLTALDAAAPELEQLVLVSTVAASWGSMAMGHVGAAAAHTGAVAARRRAAGRTCAVLESTPWADGDMVDDDSLEAGRRLGVEPLSTGLAMEAVLRAGATVAGMVATVDWELLRSVYEANRGRPMLGSLGRQLGPRIDDEALLEELRGLDPPARTERLRAYLGGIVAELLRHPLDAIDADTGFFQLGMDSIMAMQLRRRIGAAVGLPIPASTIFEYPTVARLASYLVDRLGLREAPGDDAAAAPGPAADAEDQRALAEATAMSEDDLLDALARELEEPS
ncbi:MAG: beta-ketoacyl synthase N-terminal-like domain-containing protein [Nannocystaceae bacterium]